MRRLLYLLLLLAAVPPAAADCPRIISQAPYITQSLQWLGLEECIVGVSRYDTLDRPHTGGVIDPDADAVALLQPDLLLVTDWVSEATWSALQTAAPHVLRLHGFQHMAQIEDNLQRIAAAVEHATAAERAKAFPTAWRSAAIAVAAGGRRALLLSGCSGIPYSYGQRTWLHELFTTAGFVPVDDTDGVHAVTHSDTTPSLDAFIDRLQPDVVFVFEREATPQCQLLRPQTPVRIVALDGEHFLHPAPILLHGLAELRAKRAYWMP